jgi:hypothetical protein
MSTEYSHLLVSLKKEHRAQLLLIGDVERQHLNEVMRRACERYIVAEFAAFGDELKLRLKEVVRQRQRLIDWLVAERLEGDALLVPRPDTSALKPRMSGGDPCGRTDELITLDDDHEILLNVLGDFHGLTIGAMLDRAFGDYIQSEILDDLVTFNERLNAARKTIRNSLAMYIGRLEGC